MLPIITIKLFTYFLGYIFRTQKQLEHFLKSVSLRRKHTNCRMCTIVRLYENGKKHAMSISIFLSRVHRIQRWHTCFALGKSKPTLGISKVGRHFQTENKSWFFQAKISIFSEFFFYSYFELPELHNNSIYKNVQRMKPHRTCGIILEPWEKPIDGKNAS